MEKNEALLWFGSQHKLAKFLGLHQSNISRWKKIPHHHQKEIEQHTNGELKATPRTRRIRYMCTIEKPSLELLELIAKTLDVPVVEALRQCIQFYADKNHSQKHL